jgi:4-hydroxy-3-methylbut-2-enyl diphosphate reductase
VIDATCPLVTKVHHEANRFARRNYDILLVGHNGHEEVEGTSGEAPNQVQVIDGTDSVDDIVVRDEGIVKLFGNGCGAVDVSGLGGER